MSRQTKKPAQQISTKVKNVKLLPSIFATEPNKKMLDSTLDVMTSKGQMLPFKQTHGLRSASNKIDEFFVNETNEVRRETQSNNMLVLLDNNDSYIGKTSYLDIDNYFRVKNSTLKDGVMLDKNINILDLPVIPYRITDYNLFYWASGDLPACRIHLDPKVGGGAKYSISRDLLGKPSVTLLDDFTGKSLELQTGMTIYFTGTLDAEDAYYLSVDEDSPVTFFVSGVGEFISLIRTSLIEKRIPNAYFKKRPWDKDNPYIDPPAKKWDSEQWDGSQFISSEPEYITQEKFTLGCNHWQSIDHWYHISTIRAVATFLGARVDEIVKPENRAKRPIITFYTGVKLYNWPTFTRGGVKSLLPFSKNRYQGLTSITDDTGYKLVNGDKVVFEENAGIYTVAGIGTSTNFTLDTNTADGEGAFIINNNEYQYYRLIYKNSRWGFAQNKTEPNQTPLFEFYTSEEQSIEKLNETNFKGGVILGFKSGNTYDSVLNKYIEISNIDFDLINENTSGSVSPNQIKFYTEVDSPWEYTNELTGELIKLSGPYGYKINANIFSFYQPRRGIDFTKQMQDVLYTPKDEEFWSTTVEPITDLLSVIHVYHTPADGLIFYTNVQGYGLLKFSSKKGFNIIEPLLPLVSGKSVTIVCHNLPGPLSFYRTEVLNNITTPVLLTAPYCINNNISNGVMYLDLNDSISLDGGTTYIENDISKENSVLYWSYALIQGTNRKLYRNAIVKPEYKWRFLQNVHVKDKTNPIYNEYDYLVLDDVLEDGTLSRLKRIRAIPQLLEKISDGDKITVDSIIENPTQKTAPLSLTTNPLNDNLSTINYYSLYQHAMNLKSNATNSREYIDFESLSQSSLLGGGTFIKHSSPLSKFSILATNMPYDLGELLIKQGKHYDNFLGKLKLELDKVVDTTNYQTVSSYELLSLALNNIFITNATDDTFWSHSNMLGWGEKLDNYRETDITVTSSEFELTGSFEPISHRAGKELLLQITCNNKFLVRGVDYELTVAPDLNDYYAGIKFNSSLNGQTVNIKQWYNRFKCQIPSSLAKIGLSPVYKPEIYKDTTYVSDTYFLIRHDGSKYYLEEGVDSNNYPINLIDKLLYEYEIAVWASISYDIEKNSYHDIFGEMPGYFRTKETTFNKARTSFVDETNNWLVENNIFDNSNHDYDSTNDFTKIYQLGSGDEVETTITGSWRLIYKHLFDTDRPHTHPWEMLGHTVKPGWWDTYYSWTNTSKRTELEIALRTGRISKPGDPLILDVKFARCNDLQIEQKFPVSSTGSLLSPLHVDMSWLDISDLPESTTWRLGDYNNYEQVYASTHRGIGAMAKTYFLRASLLYVNKNWVPGHQVKNNWGQYVNRFTQTWQKCQIEHDYHRSIVDGDLVYTSGIESLLSEFCLLNNKDFKYEVIDKFNNVVVNKEFLLQGFSNKDNVRIQSTSINTQKQTLFIPEESYSIRTIKHYPAVEKFYSGMRIVYDGSNYSVYGFNKEYAFFRFYSPLVGSSTTTIIVGNVRIKEKIKYDKSVVNRINYGVSFNNRFDLYDFILGYGKYLEDQGFIFEEAEGGDIRNWQLSAKQFIFWSNDVLAPGNYIDLNPAADNIILKNMGAHLENLEGTNENSGQCVDRFNKPLFAKDLLVTRDGENIVIKTRNKQRPIYGIKLTFSYYESVAHLNFSSEFGDIYFLPEQGTSKRSFALGGRKTQDWTGEYFAPGYVFTNDHSLIPNFDSMAEQGRNLLDVESVIIDPVVRDAAKDQFGLNRNVELKQLFLQEDNEIAFKTGISYNKGTIQVFDSLNPLTHGDGSQTTAYEEYMVRTGEFGNTKNIDYYEFEILSEDLNKDYNTYQIIKFIDPDATQPNDKILYIKDDSTRWVYKPLDKNLRFRTYTDRSYTELKTSGPLLPGDTNYQVDKIEDIDSLFLLYADLWTIPHYDETLSYKKYDQVRMSGKLYYARTTVSPGTWANNNDKFSEIPEPWLPNIYINNYYKPNPDLSSSGPSIFTPGTWQVLQTMDLSIGIEEICPGPTDVSKARVSTNKPHGLKKGEYIVIVNCSSDDVVVDGIWAVASVESPTKFYINTRVIDVVKKGKIFPLKPVRFKNLNDLSLATGSNAANYGYSWKKKFIPITNALGETTYELDPTPSGYDQVYPIAIVDDGLNLNRPEATYDYGNYKVYSINGSVKTLLKEESLPVDASDIEHLIIYDYNSNKTLAKLELYDPKKLLIPEVFKKDIDIIGRVDPAKYNRSTDAFKSVYTSLSWYEEQVGKRWWDTSTVNFSDYESGDEVSKAKFWGSTLSGSVPDIYEWTKSPVPPSNWATLVENKTKIEGKLATGEAYIDRSLGEENYHWVEEQEYSSGNVFTVYYFWVKNKTTIDDNSKAVRIYTTRQLSNYILNPSAAGIPWWSPISNDAIVIKGIDTYLNNSSTVIQIKKKTKGEEKHQQWTFISEGNTVETIPEWVHIRFRDSISAHIFYKIIGNFTTFSAANVYKQSDIVKFNDKFYVCRIYMTSMADFFDEYDPVTNPNGAWFELKNVFEVTGSLIGTWDGYFWDKIYWDYSLDKFWFWKSKNVPDQINLHRYNRLGNNVRPYIQSWFQDVLEARRTFIKRLNDIMINVDITTLPNWGNTRLNDVTYEIADEVADITKYWRYVDFQAENFDSTKAIGIVLENEDDIYVAGIEIGQYVKINTGIRDYIIYEKNLDQSFNVVYRTKGAIEFDKILYDPISLSTWDSIGYDMYPWDFDLNSVYNAIVDALRYEIFVGPYNKYYSSVICTMFRYVFSEQVNVDWLAKSSTIEPVNLLGKSLIKTDSLKRDEITVLTNFYSSVKSYRDKVRGGTVNKNSGDEVLSNIEESGTIKEYDSAGNLQSTYEF